MDLELDVISKPYKYKKSNSRRCLSKNKSNIIYIVV